LALPLDQEVAFAVCDVVFSLTASRAMNIVLLFATLTLWIVVLFLGFLLLGALRAVALLRWRVAQLEAITPSRLGRSGLSQGKKAPDFALPSISGGEMALQGYAGHKLLLVFMQPGCGPCQHIVPELDRLHRAGDVQVLVIQNGDVEAIRQWAKKHRPHFPVALQERFNLSKRYEVFATPFAFLIDEQGVIAARGIVGNKQFLGFVLTRAGHDKKEGDSEAEASHESHRSPADDGESSFSYSKGVDHV
jgi:methylamine dehydrogenase accessory protein MauD